MVLTILLMAALVALAAVMFFDVNEPKSFAPHSLFSPRTIETVREDGSVFVPTIDGYGEPAIRLTDDTSVPVFGSACVSSDQPVEVLTSRWWQSGEIRIQTVADFPTIHPPGCVVLRADFEIPAEIADRVQSLGPALWRITGAVTPTAPGGVTATWNTQQFWLVP
jgi:hypothetical protein